ncbi:MAG: metalloregulator ArsR/SmtB family transcription factor [Alphaproteobacteria bacterium]|nr:metalloregulator ArsR/SmtB family transcription factor [Alphaproteobacteria bacterium]
MDGLLAGLRAAAEPTRLRLLALCARGDLTVSDLTGILGQSQPSVSRHLKLLCDAGLLDRFREGAWVFYRLARDGEGGGLAGAMIGLLPPADPVLELDARRLESLKEARQGRAAAYFRANATRWGEIRSLHVDDALVERALLGMLGEGRLGDLLDIGTGTGRMLELLGPLARSGLGIDESREMLSVARATLDRAGLTHCSVRLADLYQLPLPGESIDLAVVHQVLHYAERPGAAVAEAARVLRPGGRLMVVDFAPHDLEVLRTEHEHRRLGFLDDEVAGWFREAGLEPGIPHRLPGGRLTVVIWPARRTLHEEI